MWAPADLFSPVLNIVLLPTKRMVSYFYEHPMVLALVVLAVAVTILGGRRASRSGEPRRATATPGFVVSGVTPLGGSGRRGTGRLPCGG